MTCQHSAEVLYFDETDKFSLINNSSIVFILPISISLLFTLLNRYDMQYKTLKLYHNLGEVKQYQQSENFINTAPVNEEVFVGTDGENFYKGKFL